MVDDDFDIASLIKVSLDKVGLSALPFINPLEALETFRSGFADYDLVISDIKMPRMNGCEFVKEIKKIKTSV
jgi:two-component system, cell cycle response regulator CpdR